MEVKFLNKGHKHAYFYELSYVRNLRFCCCSVYIHMCSIEPRSRECLTLLGLATSQLRLNLNVFVREMMRVLVLATVNIIFTIT